MEEEKKQVETTNGTETEVKANELTTVTTEELISNIKDTDSLDEFLPLFNLNIAKKSALRATKREEVLDLVTDKIKERLEKRPDEMTITELTAIDKTMSEQKQKEIAQINQINEQPTISVGQQTNINVNVNGLDRDSNERVIDAVKQLLKIAQEQQPEPEIVEDFTESE